MRNREKGDLIMSSSTNEKAKNKPKSSINLGNKIITSISSIIMLSFIGIAIAFYCKKELNITRFIIIVVSLSLAIIMNLVALIQQNKLIKLNTSFVKIDYSQVLNSAMLCLQAISLIVTANSTNLLFYIFNTLTAICGYGLYLYEISSKGKTFNVASFCIFIGSTIISVLIICTIKNESLMSIIASIFAAIVGGLLTLSGVIMTINHNNKLKLENDCNQAKPLFSFSQPDYSFKTSARKCFCRENLYSNYPYEVSFVLENSNQSVIYITKIILIMKKFCIDSTDKSFDYINYDCEGSTTILPTSSVSLKIKFDKNAIILLQLCDICGNSWYYYIDYATNPESTHNEILGIRELGYISANSTITIEELLCKGGSYGT